jgi:hypothetical protein
MKSFICFSSGAQPRYRDDIIRVMAMPDGCEITFRYRLKYLAPSVREHLKSGQICAGDRVLISYLDQSDKSQPVFFVPVRYATIMESPTVGDFAVLRMRVAEFAYAADLEALNREMQIASVEVPRWSSDPNITYATGSFWVEVSAYPKSIVASESIADWQIAVGQLMARKDFASEGPFFQVVKLEEVRSGREVRLNNGQLCLCANTEYQLLIDHFLPREETGTFQLEALFAGQAITFITGAKIQIDSPYDRHWLRFKTREPLKEERAVITLTKKQTGEDATVQFDLPVAVEGQGLKAVLIGVAVGALLALPQIITAWVNPAFQPRGLTWLIGLSGIIFVLNMGVGIAAALNFRRPI